MGIKEILQGPKVCTGFMPAVDENWPIEPATRRKRLFSVTHFTKVVHYVKHVQRGRRTCLSNACLACCSRGARQNCSAEWVGKVCWLWLKICRLVSKFCWEIYPPPTILWQFWKFSAILKIRVFFLFKVKFPSRVTSRRHTCPTSNTHLLVIGWIILLLCPLRGEWRTITLLPWNPSFLTISNLSVNVPGLKAPNINLSLHNHLEMPSCLHSLKQTKPSIRRGESGWTPKRAKTVKRLTNSTIRLLWSPHCYPMIKSILIAPKYEFNTFIHLHHASTSVNN